MHNAADSHHHCYYDAAHVTTYNIYARTQRRSERARTRTQRNCVYMLRRQNSRVRTRAARVCARMIQGAVPRARVDAHL